MNFSPETIEYLKGSKFQNSWKIDLGKGEKKIPERIEYLVDLIKNKKVIHIGCVDHIPLIEKKISENCWVHQLLLQSASQICGIDINKEGVEYIKNKGYENIYCIDLIKEELPSEITNIKWDYLILGEILEHVDNPVDFLKNIHKKFLHCADSIVITVPNALSWHNFINSLKRYENINTDHRLWFTPYTLAKIGNESHFKVKLFQFCLNYKLFKYSLFKRQIYKVYPSFRDSLVMIFSF